mgnify:FL=1
MNIKILGSGCANCARLEKNTKKAIAERGLEASIEKVTDFKEIASFNILRTPGLVVDGKVVASGKVLSVEEIKKLL